MVKIKKCLEISKDSMETLIDALDILRAIVDEFEGEISYRKTMENADYYIYNPESSIKMLEVG